MEEDIKKAVDVMRAGGIVLYPTDTVWGIGCDATNVEAVEKVYSLKQRAESKALILLVDSMVKVQSYIAEVPDIAWDLVELSEKPLTIIYDEARGLAKNLIAEDGSVAMRVTGEDFSRKLCQRMKVPVVSTSANISGTPAPGVFSEISQEIIDGVDYVVYYKRDYVERVKPSSIIKLSVSGVVKIIR